MGSGRQPAQLLGSVGGALLAALTRIVAALRPSAKPAHPRGHVAAGALRRTGARPPTGVAWLDQPGTDRVLVRLSRAIGLPAGLPDFLGLALRVPVGERYGDILFASTGMGRIGRFLLRPSFSPSTGPLSTLLPYRTPEGPLLLAVTPTSESHFELWCAGASGTWRPVGSLTLEGPDADALVSFDPVLNTVPGLENYAVVRALRERAYRVARRARRER